MPRTLPRHSVRTTQSTRLGVGEPLCCSSRKMAQRGVWGLLLPLVVTLGLQKDAGVPRMRSSPRVNDYRTSADSLLGSGYPLFSLSSWNVAKVQGSCRSKFSG